MRVPVPVRVLVLAAVLVLHTGTARAAPDLLLNVVAAEGGCPDAAAVSAAISQALPGVRIIAGTAPPGTLPVQVDDQGGRYRVTVAGSQREFADPRRQCAERARAVAVFVALLIEPPLVPAAESPSPSPPPPVPRRHVQRSADVHPHLDLEPSALLYLAFGGTADGPPITGGGALRAVAGGHHLGVGLGAGLLAPVTLNLGAASARLTRVPLDLFLRLMLRRGPVEGAAELGLDASVLLLTGISPAGPLSARVDPGVFLGALLRVWFRDRVAPFVALRGIVSLRPYDLVVVPLGTVGGTPQLWLEGSLGISLRLW